MHVPCPLPLVAACLLLLPAAAAQDEPGKPPAPGQEAPKPLDEKDLVHEYDKTMKEKDPAVRSAAVTALGEASRNLADRGKTRFLAKALGKALEDEDLGVQSAAVIELSWGRDVDTVLGLLGDHVEATRKEVEKRITRPNDEDKEYVNRATRLFGDACWALANYRDDRTVETLAAIMGRLRANTDGNNTSTRLVGRIAEPLLQLGTADAVSSVVRQLQQYTATDSFQEPAAKELHRVLAQFATKVGKAPPDFTENFYVAWDDWFEEHGEGFPRKLGKLKEPPEQPPADLMDKGGREMADDGGPAPR